MGMNDDLHPLPDGELDDLAAYALDAHDPDDETAIELHLLATPQSAGWEAVLRDAAGEFGADAVDDEDPPPALRDRVMSAALAARPPGTPAGGPGPGDEPSPFVVHRIEQQRALLYLQDVGPDDWRRPVDPPEFAGWTVHDLVAHLAALATLLADTLGEPVAGVPETEIGNEDRTAAAQARHRDLSPSVAIAEIDAAARAVDRAVAGLDDAGLDEEVTWLGIPMQIRWILIARAFETWTHVDDIRRAVGDEMSPPPVGSLRTMSRAACGFMPLMLAVRGQEHPGKVVRVRFTDLADTAWDVDLGDLALARPAGDDPVDTELTLDAVDLCRALGNRLPEGGLPYASTGDAELAAVVVDAVPALAQL